MIEALLLLSNLGTVAAFAYVYRLANAERDRLVRALMAHTAPAEFVAVERAARKPRPPVEPDPEKPAAPYGL